MPRHQKGNTAAMEQGGKKRHHSQALYGRGRKCARWVEVLYAELNEEYARLNAENVKTSPSQLVTTAKYIVEHCPSDSELKALKLAEDKFCLSRINVRWIQYFMTHHNLVIRRQTGNLARSAEKSKHIRKSIAYHLGTLKRGFESGNLDQDALENAEETHFIFNMDNGRTIGLRETEHVKYADVFFGMKVLL